MYDDVDNELPEVTDEEAEREIEIPATDYAFVRSGATMEPNEARANVIASFVDAPGGIFSLEEFTERRLLRYGQSRAWQRDLLEELEDGGLIAVTDEEPNSWVITESADVLARWA